MYGQVHVWLTIALPLNRLSPNCVGAWCDLTFVLQPLPHLRCRSPESLPSQRCGAEPGGLPERQV